MTNAATPSNFDSAGSAGNHGCATSGAGLPMPVDRGCSGGFRFEKCRNAGKPAKLPTQMLHRPCVSIEHPATSCSALAGPRIATNHRNFWRCDRPRRTGFCCSHVDYIRPSKTAHIAQTGDSVASYGSLPPLRLAHTWARTSRPDDSILSYKEMATTALDPPNRWVQRDCTIIIFGDTPTWIIVSD